MGKVKELIPGIKVQFSAYACNLGNTGIVVDGSAYMHKNINYSGYTFVLWDVVNNISPITTKHLIVR